MLRRILAVPMTAALLLSDLGQGRAAGLTFDEIFSAAPAWASQPVRFVWAPRGRSFLYVLSNQDQTQAQAVREYDVPTGESRMFIEPAHYGDRPGPAGNVAWSPDGSRVAFTEHGALYVRDTATNFERAVAQNVSDALWSPRGDAIAYTSGANLFVAQLTPRLHTFALTSGGVPGSILCGDLDWVYPEELGTEHGFAWSPDGRTIAYMRMDERAVTNFPTVDFLAPDNTISYQRYPLAGERNPRVTLHTVHLSSRADARVYDAAARDEYLPFFGWKPGTRALLAEVLDRSQKRLRVLAWGDGGAPAELYSQSAAQWVDDVPLPVWLHDGSGLYATLALLSVPLLGQEAGVRYLQSLLYVDASRVGIWGWSFGGYETIYALSHSTLFKAGAAGAPVTDRHLYDAIYTERYMGLPKDDPKAYDESSNLNAMKNLRGDLLVSQGTSDDNVHVANSISLMQSAIAADITHVDYMVYPRQRHGFTALADLRNLYEHMLEWWSAHL